MWVAVTGPRSKVTLTGPSPSFPLSVLCPHVWVLAWSCGHSSAPPPTSPVKGRPCWTENKNHGFQVHFILYHGIGCLARNMVPRVGQRTLGLEMCLRIHCSDMETETRQI